MSGRSDYSFHFYTEVCQFVYCLLSRTRKIASLPELNSWEEYMDEQRVDEFENVAASDFLRNHSFGVVLQGRKDSDGRSFREQCIKFLDRLVDAVLMQQPVTGEFFCGLYAFSPELLLEGDDYRMLELFRKLVRVLESSGCVTSLESRTVVEEYSTFVVDARKRHMVGGSSAEDISDVRQHLLSDYSFLSQKPLCRVFKLCCLVVLKPRSGFPVDIVPTHCEVPEWVVATCVSGAQSSVSSSDFKLGTFFTKFTMNEVRDSIDAAQTFMSQADFDPWAGICGGGGQAAFVERYTDLFNARLSRKKSRVSQQVSAYDESSRGVQPGGDDGVSAAVLSDSAASAVSAPPVSTSSGSNSFRQSKTPIHSSLASLLGRKKDASKRVVKS